MLEVGICLAQLIAVGSTLTVLYSLMIPIEQHSMCRLTVGRLLVALRTSSSEDDDGGGNSAPMREIVNN